MSQQKLDRRQHLSRNVLIVTLGAEIVSHRSHDAASEATLLGKGKHTHTHAQALHSLSRAREREKKLMKKQISVQMCSFDMRNRNRSLCAERIKTWAVSWLGLCTPIGVWNDLHLHKVHAQIHTHMAHRAKQHAVRLHKFTTQLGLGGGGREKKKKRLLHKA